MLKSVLIILALVALASARPGEVSKIDSKLEEKLRRQDVTNIFVNFAEGTSAVLQNISNSVFDSRDERLIALQSALDLNAQSTQANVTDLLNQYGSSYVVLWITNQIFVRNADLHLVLSLIRFEEVSSIIEEQVVRIRLPQNNSPIITRRQDPTLEWGLQKIQVGEALALLNATVTASPIIISTIDTGVRGTHEALRDNFLGEYGWYDPHDRTTTPNDNNGHGTHTTGTIAGKGGIGVYPEAKWMACKGCATGSCAEADLIECGQFILCPTLTDGSAKDCTMAPHLVSNSWEGGVDRDFYDGVIAAWNVGGIIPVFAAGNSGTSCGSLRSPGDRVGVIAVGSTTSSDSLSYFSSVGPAVDGRIRPDISAPGSEILSAYNSADDAYRTLSGTSMATPHVGGLTAILMAYDPDLTFEGVRDALNAGADQNVITGNQECGGVRDDEFPNNHFGYGRANALKSLSALIEKDNL